MNVGWVEAPAETHQGSGTAFVMGFASLYPSYVAVHRAYQSVNAGMDSHGGPWEPEVIHHKHQTTTPLGF